MAIAGRAPIPALHLFEDHDTAYDLWTAAGVKGRTLVHLDGHLDFNWIVDHSVEDLLKARTPEEFYRLAGGVKGWNLDRTPRRKKIHIGNFIGPAVEEGMISRFFWVVPDPFWSSPRQRQAVFKDLQVLARKNPSAATSPVWDGSTMTMRLWNCPLTVCTFAQLPAFTRPVLLDIDVDYFVTRVFEGAPPYYRKGLHAPWVPLDQFWKRLRQASIPTDFATICYSVNQGYTPLASKWIGDHLRDALARPARGVRRHPHASSAAAAYRQFQRALARHAEAAAKKWWARMVERDPSYRTLYATPAYREESFHTGSAKKSLRYYDQLIRLDPEWHVAHFGRGRVLCQLGHWAQAEESLERALALASGPSFIRYWLGLCAQQQGDAPRAGRLWRETYQDFPDQPLLQRALQRLEHSPTSQRSARRNTTMTPMNPLETTFERSPGIVTRKILDEVILVPVTPRIDQEAALFTLDTVGASLWAHLAAPLTGRQLSDALQRDYDVPSGQADADVKVFLEQLLSAGVVRVCASEALHAVR